MKSKTKFATKKGKAQLHEIQYEDVEYEQWSVENPRTIKIPP